MTDGRGTQSLCLRRAALLSATELAPRPSTVPIASDHATGGSGGASLVGGTRNVPPKFLVYHGLSVFPHHAHFRAVLRTQRPSCAELITSRQAGGRNLEGQTPSNEQQKRTVNVRPGGREGRSRMDRPYHRRPPETWCASKHDPPDGRVKEQKHPQTTTTRRMRAIL